MIKKLSIAVALLGLAIALVAALTTDAEAPEPRLASTPSINPYDNSVAATGIVEGRTRNIRIAPPEPGLVTEVLVQVNDRAQRDDPLFRVDARALRAERLTAAARRDAARQELDRLLAQPRQEDIPIARAELQRLRAEQRDAEDALRRVRRAEQRDAASEREVERLRFAADAAEAAADAADAQLQRLLDGAWEPDVAIARAQLDLAEARLNRIDRLIERRTVRAPTDATILKRNIEPGEFATPADAEPALVIADLSQIIVRAQVNEEDIPELDHIADAVARPRADLTQRIELALHRVEPLAIPKRSLTGAPTELVDTRVVEMLFRVEGQPPRRLYPGQLVDVFIRLDPPDQPAPDQPAPDTANDP